MKTGNAAKGSTTRSEIHLANWLQPDKSSE